MATKGLVSLLIQAKDDASQALDAVIKKTAELPTVEKAAAASARELTAAEKNLAEAQKLGFKTTKDLLAALDAKTGKLRAGVQATQAVASATVAGTRASAAHSGAVQNEVNQLRGLGIEAQRVAAQEVRLAALRARLPVSTQANLSDFAAVRNAIELKRRADERSVASSFAVANALRGQSAAAVGAVPGFGKLQNAAQQLAFGLSGIPGAAGRVISTLATFTLGGGWTLGVVAGITALVAIWDHFTSTQREAKRATQELIDKLVEEADLRSGKTARESRANLEAQLKSVDAEKRLFDAQAKQPRVGGARGAELEKAAELGRQKNLEARARTIKALGALYVEDAEKYVEGVEDQNAKDRERAAEQKRLADEARQRAKERLDQLRMLGDAERALNALRAQGPEEQGKARAAIRTAEITRQVEAATALTSPERETLRVLLEQADARKEQVRINDEANDLLERQIELLNAADPIYQALLEKELKRLAAFKEFLLIQGRIMLEPAKFAGQITVGLLGVGAATGGGKRTGEVDTQEPQIIGDIRTGLTNALADFLARGISTFETLGQAIANFGRSVIQMFLDIFAQIAAEKAVSGFLKFLGVKPPVAAAGGGVVHGPGTGTSDSIPALLSTGEGIVTAKAVDFFGGPDFIAGLNTLNYQMLHQRVPRLATGGVVGAATGGTGNGASAALVKVMLEDGLIARQMETGPAVRAAISVIAKNKRAVRSALGL